MTRTSKFEKTSRLQPNLFKPSTDATVESASFPSVADFFQPLRLPSILFLPRAPTWRQLAIMADIRIDAKLFQERISHFINAWKGDKRAGDSVFAGASSIVILMGKVENDNPEFHKNNAMHVRRGLPLTFGVSRIADRFAVLADGIRVSYHADAPHTRLHLHPDDAEERYAPRAAMRKLHTDSFPQPNTWTKSRLAGSQLKCSCGARMLPKTRSTSQRSPIPSKMPA